jgi:hypothetical protein
MPKDAETTAEPAVAEPSTAETTETAEPSTTEAEPTEGGSFEHVDLDMTAKERAAWLDKGTVPERFNGPEEEPAPKPGKNNDTEKPAAGKKGGKSEKPAASSTSTAPKGEDAETTVPASETGEEGKASQPKQPAKPGSGAERRIPQLSREISDLLAQRKQLRQELDDLAKQKNGGGETAPAPKPSPVGQAAETALPKKPNENDYKTYAEYETAKDKYWSDLLELERTNTQKAVQESVQTAIDAYRKDSEKAAEQQRVDQYNREVTESWQKRTADAQKRHAEDFLAVAEGAADLPINKTMDAYILKSEYGAEILYRLGKDFLEGGEIAKEIAALDAYETMERLVEIKNEIAVEMKPKEAPKPVLPRVTKTPVDLGGKNAAPVDEAEAALDAEDFAKYRQIMNKRDRDRATAPQ